MNPDLAGVSELLASLACPWGFCGGWAIDLFIGRPMRDHKDIDVAVFRQDQRDIRTHFVERGYSARKIVKGAAEPWAEGEWLALPVHEIWCENSAKSPARIELLLNESREGDFLFRRDRSIAMPLDRATMLRGGMRFLAPEIVLLYKSSDAGSPGNCQDFENVLPFLGNGAREWLRNGLEKTSPGHEWIGRLKSSGSSAGGVRI